MPRCFPAGELYGKYNSFSRKCQWKDRPGDLKVIRPGSAAVQAPPQRKFTLNALCSISAFSPSIITRVCGKFSFPSCLSGRGDTVISQPAQPTLLKYSVILLADTLQTSSYLTGTGRLPDPRGRLRTRVHNCQCSLQGCPAASGSLRRRRRARKSSHRPSFEKRHNY